MAPISPEQLLQQLNWRYAVKKFDSAKKIEDETWAALEQAMILAPSSYGLQPWKFVVITEQAIKDQLPAISYKQEQPRDCSHMVVLAARKQVDEAYINLNMQAIEEQRGLEKGAMNSYRDVLIKTVANIEDHVAWNSLQVYIALGQLMTSAALLGVDTCPMEGIIPGKYDDICGFEGTEFKTIVACACGYRSSEDSLNAKVRFPHDALISGPTKAHL